MAMPRGYNRYQYETSPRKIDPIKDPKRIPTAPKKTSTRNVKKEQVKSNNTNKVQIKLVLYLVLTFAVVFAIGYRNTQINETFNAKQKIEKQLSVVNKENGQIEVNIQNSLNLSQIEQEAKERLGMQKLTNKQTIYIDLPKKDYVESGTEEIIIQDEEEGFIQSIINTIVNIFK